MKVKHKVTEADKKKAPPTSQGSNIDGAKWDAVKETKPECAPVTGLSVRAGYALGEVA
jgi:hypothetical protein